MQLPIGNISWYNCYQHVKSVQIRSYFWSVFPRIRSEYGEIVSLYIQSKCRKIRTRNNSQGYDQKRKLFRTNSFVLEQLTVKSPIQWYHMTLIWRHLVLDVITGIMYLFLCLHLLIISDLLFSMLSFLCRAMASFSLRHRRHRLEPWLYDLWVSKISQDMLGVLFTDIIFQFSFDSSVSVWYLMLLNVFLWFAYLSLNAVSQTP